MMFESQGLKNTQLPGGRVIKTEDRIWEDKAEMSRDVSHGCGGGYFPFLQERIAVRCGFLEAGAKVRIKW